MCHGPKGRHQMCTKCIPDTKDPKDKESKSKITNWSKKFNCVKILSPKSSSHVQPQKQPQQQQQQPSSPTSMLHRQGGSTDANNSIVKHAEMKVLNDLNDRKMAAEAIKRLLDLEK